jgi:hypothetical protein
LDNSGAWTQDYHLGDKCSTAWATPPILITLFFLVGLGHLNSGLCTCKGGTPLSILLWLLLEKGFMNYLPGWSWTMICLISAFQVGRITDISHQHLAWPLSLTRHFWRSNQGPTARKPIFFSFLANRSHSVSTLLLCFCHFSKSESLSNLRPVLNLQLSCCLRIRLPFTPKGPNSCSPPN